MRLRQWKPKLAKGSPRSKLQCKHDLGKDGKDPPMENYITVTTTINYMVRKLKSENKKNKI